MSDDATLPPAVQINLRPTFDEEGTIQQASAALLMTPSALIQLGLIQACTDLRMMLLDDEAPRLKPGFVWPFIPVRPEGASGKLRLTAYLQAALHPTVETAAWALRISVPMFAIGAALRLISLAKLVNERRAKSEPGKFNAQLAAVHVPYGFDEVAKAAK